MDDKIAGVEEKLSEHAPDYSPAAWTQYTVDELRWWVALLTKRAETRESPEKREKDLNDAKNYQMMLNAMIGEEADTLTEYCVIQDDDGHWYVIPADKVIEFWRWVEFESGNGIDDIWRGHDFERCAIDYPESVIFGTYRIRQ